MKTAVSLPDELFRRGEAAAGKLRVSRSQMYARAIAEYLDRIEAESVTARLNEIYSGAPTKLDPKLHRTQIKSLHKEAW